MSIQTWKLVGAICTSIALSGAFLLTSTRAEDGAALYKSKCAVCHSPDGSGRKVLKGTNLLSDEAKKRTDAQLTDYIAKGGPKRDAAHAYEKKGLTAGQITQLVAHIRALQKPTGK